MPKREPLKQVRIERQVGKESEGHTSKPNELLNIAKKTLAKEELASGIGKRENDSFPRPLKSFNKPYYAGCEPKLLSVDYRLV